MIPSVLWNLVLLVPSLVLSRSVLLSPDPDAHDSALTNAPTCAQSCINTLVPKTFSPYVCGSDLSSTCLCSRYANAGPSLGDVYSYCIRNYCSPDGPVSIAQYYNICSSTIPATSAAPREPGVAPSGTTEVGSDVAGAVTSARVLVQSTGASKAMYTTLPSEIINSDEPVSPQDVSVASPTATVTASIVEAISTDLGPVQTATIQDTLTRATSTPPSTQTITSTTTATASASAATDGGWVNPGSVAGLAVAAMTAAVVGFVLIGSLVSFLFRRRRRRQREQWQKTSGTPRFRPAGSSPRTKRADLALAMPELSASGAFPKMQSKDAGRRSFLDPKNIGLAIGSESGRRDSPDSTHSMAK